MLRARPFIHMLTLAVLLVTGAFFLAQAASQAAAAPSSYHTSSAALQRCTGGYYAMSQLPSAH